MNAAPSDPTPSDPTPSDPTPSASTPSDPTPSVPSPPEAEAEEFRWEAPEEPDESAPRAVSGRVVLDDAVKQFWSLTFVVLLIFVLPSLPGALLNGELGALADPLLAVPRLVPVVLLGHALLVWRMGAVRWIPLFLGLLAAWAIVIVVEDFVLFGTVALDLILPGLVGFIVPTVGAGVALRVVVPFLRPAPELQLYRSR